MYESPTGLIAPLLMLSNSSRRLILRCCKAGSTRPGQAVCLAQSGQALIAYGHNMSTVDYAALLVSLPTSKQLRSPEYLTKAIVEAVTQTQKSLAVVVFSPLFSTDPSHSAESLANAPVHSWKTVQNLLTFIYVQAAREAQRLDKILLNVDVVLHDSRSSGLGSGVWKNEAERWQAIFALDDGLGTSLLLLALSCSLGWQYQHVQPLG